MIITVENSQTKVELDGNLEKILRAGLNAVADRHKLSAQTEIGVTIVDDDEIHVINRDYRGVDRATDVISFALNDDDAEADMVKLVGTCEEELLGDIIISAETALRQGEEFGHGLEREIVYLAVHGLLHLLGYDHMNEEEKKIMRREEEASLRVINLAEENFE
ncbi:MAG: rRNA maturation RNase YbeY [Acidaminococcaceae bacterium]|nr:rRNA maturation RNase YbeY [Acidaminococcaceae bacterium]